MASSSEVGPLGEAIAAQVLVAHGYSVIDLNWRSAAGEIDIVARDGYAWVFVEVKTRVGQSHGSPQEAVTPRKQSRLVKASEGYLVDHELAGVDWRIDVVAINLAPSRRILGLELFKNAVRGDNEAT